MLMVIDAYHVTSFFFLNGYYPQGLATSCCARCTIIDSLIVSRALYFPSDGHFLAAVTWDINHSRIYNGVRIGQHAHLLCISLLLRCHHTERFCFTHFEFYGCWRAADVAYFSIWLYVWSRCCMFGSKQSHPGDKLCFQYKRQGGEYGLCLMYLLSVLTSFTPQTYVVSIKMLSKTMHFVVKVSLNIAAFEQIHPDYDTGI